jgi:hypothetical protein
MINKTELRIGNLITAVVSLEYAPTGLIEVAEICHDGVESTKYMEYAPNYPFGYAVYPYEGLEAVPLTIEWLHKFGFTFENRIHYNGLRLSVTFVRYDSAEPFLQLDSPFGSTTLKFVHQLQNWFFALTGQELIVKP